MAKQTIKFQGYKIIPHQWTETHVTYGQYDIFVSQKTTKHSGFKVLKGKRKCGRAETIAQCKRLIKKDQKYRSQKIKKRIKELKKLEDEMFKIATQREKSSNARIRASADYFYTRSRIASNRCFNLEMLHKSENWRY